MIRAEDVISRMIDDWEKGFVNHPNDRGGPTNFGISLDVYSHFLGRPATVEDIRQMPRAHAVAIYRSHYWDQPGITMLPEAVQPVLFDMAVNLGPGTAVRLLQQALDDLGRPVQVDGVIGKITSGTAARAVADLGAAAVVNAICARRHARYEEIIARDPSQACFRAGWLRRCDSFRLPA